MKKILVFLLMNCILVFSLYSQDFDPYKGKTPVFTLIQTDPWRMVIGSDTPLICLYDDGELVYRTDEVMKSFQFERNDYNLIIKQLENLTPATEIYTQSLSSWTDQPQTLIYMNIDDVEYGINIYGLSMNQFNQNGFLEVPNRPDELNERIWELYSYLIELSYHDGILWEPEFIEVMIWDYDYAPEESIIWPESWPDLNSDRCIERGRSFSIYLNFEYKQDLINFLETRNQKGAIEINGRKFAVSFRLVFQGEPQWRSVLF